MCCCAVFTNYFDRHLAAPALDKPYSSFVLLHTQTHTNIQYLLPFVSFHYFGFSLFVTTVVAALYFVVRFVFITLQIQFSFPLFRIYFFFLLFSWLLWRGPWENFDRDWKSLIVLLLPYIVSVFMIFLYFVCYYRACLFIQFIHSFVEMQHAAL